LPASKPIQNGTVRRSPNCPPDAARTVLPGPGLTIMGTAKARINSQVDRAIMGGASNTRTMGESADYSGQTRYCQTM